MTQQGRAAQADGHRDGQGVEFLGGWIAAGSLNVDRSHITLLSAHLLLSVESDHGVFFAGSLAADIRIVGPAI